MESDGIPAGQEGGTGIEPLLLEALAGVDPATMQVIGEVIVLHREFPAWAVWLPHGGRPWIAVRPASARVPGPELPMVWTQSGTAADLAGKMRSVDAQVTPR